MEKLVLCSRNNSNYLTHSAQKGKGPWQDGIYEFDYLGMRNGHQQKGFLGSPFVQHSDDSPNSSYGTYGSLVTEAFYQSGGKVLRTTMAIHSGKMNKDFLERRTLGCIRTEDIAILVMRLLQQIDPLEFIVVKNNKKRPGWRKLNSREPHAVTGSLPHEKSAENNSDREIGVGVNLLKDLGPIAIVRVSIN